LYGSGGEYKREINKSARMRNPQKYNTYGNVFNKEKSNEDEGSEQVKAGRQCNSIK